jgi:ribosome biogenesis protein
LRGHTATVSRAVLDKVQRQKAYSAGWDHVVRVWDLETGQEENTKVRCPCTGLSAQTLILNESQTSDKVAMDLDQMMGTDLLVTGSMDRTVCFWDFRQGNYYFSTVECS